MKGHTQGSGRTITKGWTDMTNDTDTANGGGFPIFTAATLSMDDLETVTDALRTLRSDLLHRQEGRAARYIGTQINICNGEFVERHNRMIDELAAIEAGSGHITLGGHDEVAAKQGAAGPWTAVCETCENVALTDGRGRDSIAAAHIGYYQTEVEAEAARARHVEEAGDRPDTQPG